MYDYKETKSWEAACAAPHVNHDPNVIPDVSMIEDKDFANWIVNKFKQVIITKAINPEGYWPNWSNRSERKYSAWPEVATVAEDGSVNPAGVGFSDSHYFYSFTYAFVGSRLTFADLPREQHAFKYFNDIFFITLLR